MSVLSSVAVVLLCLETLKAWRDWLQTLTMFCLAFVGTCVSVFSMNFSEFLNVFEGGVKVDIQDGSAIELLILKEGEGMLLCLFMIAIVFFVACGFSNLRTWQTLIVQLITTVAFCATLPGYERYITQECFSFVRSMMMFACGAVVTFLVSNQLEHRQQVLFLHNRKFEMENKSIRETAKRLRSRMRLLETQVGHIQGDGKKTTEVQSLVEQMEQMATDGTLFQVFMKAQEPDCPPSVKASCEDVLAKFAIVAADPKASRKIQMAHSAINVAKMWMDRMNEETIDFGQAEIFMGGSCNPTTWRKDIAIPYFKKMGMKYYNPQVSEWYEELAREEARAKEEAFVLLFVIDHQTRALASILEATEHICRGRVLVLVIEDVEQGYIMEGSKTALDESQVKDLNRARAYLRDVADRHGVEYHTNVKDGCIAAYKITAAAAGMLGKSELAKIR